VQKSARIGRFCAKLTKLKNFLREAGEKNRLGELPFFPCGKPCGNRGKLGVARIFVHIVHRFGCGKLTILGINGFFEKNVSVEN
jgi:hypothetical protein